VIGQGYFGQAAVLPAFDRAKNSELVGLFSEDETKLKALKRKYRVEHALSYDQYDEFLKSGAVDAVYIALPNDKHCEYTVRAAKAGVHVLCEKPMAVTSEECREMISACADAGVKLMIAYRLHFEEANLTAVELVKKQKIGEARFFSSVFSMPVKEDNIRTSPRERGGGPLYDIGIYCINAARYLFGAEPTEVQALTATKPGDIRFKDVEEQLSAVLHFPDERLATFTACFGGSDVNEYRVVGTKGWIRMEPAYEFAMALHMEMSRDGKVKKEKFKKRDQVAPEIIYFADCIREDREPEPSGYEGLTDVSIIEAIYESVTAGRRVSVRASKRGERPSRKQERKEPPHDIPKLIDAETPSAE
jgi:glucose-fructose oxidoreductase